MYIITSDFKHYLRLGKLDEAKRLANGIRGGVYLSTNGQMALLYHHTDQE